MFEIPSFPFKKLSFCICALLGMCFWTEDALAQSEQDKVEIENSRHMEKSPSTDQITNLESSTSKVTNSKQSPSIGNIPAATRKDNLTSGEGKKTESTTAPSTLSFNIFLYIVDKFKAD